MSTWTGVGGPYTCKEEKVCTFVLPGGVNATITGTGTVDGGGGFGESTSRVLTIATTPGKTSTLRGGPTSTGFVGSGAVRGVERGGGVLVVAGVLGVVGWWL